MSGPMDMDCVHTESVIMIIVGHCMVLGSLRCSWGSICNLGLRWLDGCDHTAALHVCRFRPNNFVVGWLAGWLAANAFRSL